MCLCLKITCLILILAKQICEVVKHSMVFHASRDAFYIGYIPLIIVEAIFEATLLSHLRREIYADLYWWKTSFRSVFIFLCLRFWLLLYVQIFIDLWSTDTEFFTVGIMEHIANAVISLLIILLLFRPVIFSSCVRSMNRVTEDIPTVYAARDQRVGLPDNYRGVSSMQPSGDSQANTNESHSFCFLVTSTVFLVLYLGGIIFLIHVDTSS